MAIYVNGIKVAGRGISGQSSYQIAVNEGYEGTEAEFHQALKSVGDAAKGFQELQASVTGAKAEINAAVEAANQAVSNAQTDINTAKGEINTAVNNAKSTIASSISSGKTEITNAVNAATREIDEKIENALAQVPDAENIATKAYVDAAVADIVTDIWHAGTSAPANKKLLWIDTNSSTGGLKYYNGSSWVHVPVAWS